MSKVHEIVTEKILEALDRGVVPWSRPWNLTGGHQNLKGRKYRGVNPLLLEIAADAKGYDLPYWGTFNQVKSHGGKVKKGEKGTLVTFWKVYEKENPETGEEERRFILRYFNVFNVAQTEGMKWTAPETVSHDHDPIREGDALIEGMPNAPVIQVKASDRAYYRPGTDTVVLPQLDQYAVAADFYRVAFHELVHATGHESRLDRNLSEAIMRDDSYANEELVAEIGAAMLCGVAGIDSNIEQNAAYIAGWRRKLTDDPKLIVSAAGKAQKAADYIIGAEPESD